MKMLRRKTGAAAVIAVIFIIQAFNLAASDITIVKNSDSSLLLINTAALSSDDAFIEIQLSGEGLLTLSDGSEYRNFRFTMGDQPETVCLYTELTGLQPDRITVSGSSFDILSATIGRRTETETAQADIGHIIFSEFNNERDWEVYSWNLLPEVLIFDTRDYRIQSNLFKRLAFFVEKPGYIGRLVPNDELEGKHGWNAHDYKADDLAEFFSKAEHDDFELNPEEIELRRLLLEKEIIKNDENGYAEGKGAVLSVSRETLPNWRYRFLTHECLHGIFFTDEDYKDEMFQAFSELQPEEVEFWKHLLDYRRYNVENRYLLVNEFMAYSLQQPVEEVNEYFKGFLYRKMIAARPYEEPFVDNFEDNFPNSFTSTVTTLEKILYSHTGRIAGHLANIYPAETDDSFFNLFPPLYTISTVKTGD